MSPDTKVLVDLFSQIGLPSTIILAMILAGWKLFPHVVAWLKQNAAQAKVVSELMPRMELSLSRMADDGSSTKILLIEANRKLDILIAKGH